MNQNPGLESTTRISTVGDAGGPANNSSNDAANLPLTFAGLSHVGLVRSNNEDQFLIVRLHKSLDLLQTSLPADQLLPLTGREGYVILVADGIGGRAGGERASTIAVKGAAEYLLGAAKWFFRLDDPDEAVRLRLLQAATRCEATPAR